MAVLHFEHTIEGNTQLDTIGSRSPKDRTLEITQAVFFPKQTCYLDISRLTKALGFELQFSYLNVTRSDTVL